jgi:hypothetical protein
MPEKDFEAKLIKLRHDFDQLDAKIDDEISSLREELAKRILEVNLTQIGNISLSWLTTRKALAPSLSNACDTAHQEIRELTTEYLKELPKISAEEFEKRHPSFKDDINRIARSAGLGEIWKTT